jgi:hypothetical protein
MVRGNINISFPQGLKLFSLLSSLWAKDREDDLAQVRVDQLK